MRGVTKTVIGMMAAIFGATSLAGTGARAQGADGAAWRSAQSQNTAGAYSDFLRLYPTSPHAADALSRLMQIEAPALPASDGSLDRSYVMY